MTQDKAMQGLLILIVSPKLEEMLVDMLLQQAAISGFTTSNVSGHGSSHGNGKVQLSLVEQVTGRQQRVQFMLHAALADLQTLIADLKAKFQNTDIHYILMPIAETQVL